MNSDYESKELHSLVESSFDDELRYDSNNISKDDKLKLYILKLYILKLYILPVQHKLTLPYIHYHYQP